MYIFQKQVRFHYLSTLVRYQLLFCLWVNSIHELMSGTPIENKPWGHEWGMMIFFFENSQYKNNRIKKPNSFYFCVQTLGFFFNNTGVNQNWTKHFSMNLIFIVKHFFYFGKSFGCWDPWADCHGVAGVQCSKTAYFVHFDFSHSHM